MGLSSPQPPLKPWAFESEQLGRRPPACACMGDSVPKTRGSAMCPKCFWAIHMPSHPHIQRSESPTRAPFPRLWTQMKPLSGAGTSVPQPGGPWPPPGSSGPTPLAGVHVSSQSPGPGLAPSVPGCEWCWCCHRWPPSGGGGPAGSLAAGCWSLLVNRKMPPAPRYGQLNPGLSGTNSSSTPPQ